MDCNKLTAASRSLVLGSCILVNEKVLVKINDRGPCFSKECQAARPDLLKRKLDFSHGAGKALGLTLGLVKYKVVECKRH